MSKQRPRWRLRALATLVLFLSACGEGAPALPTPALDLAPLPTANTPASEAQTASAEPTPMSDDSLISTGKLFYAKYCASCHQLNGEGTAIYPPLNNNPLITREDPAPAIHLVLYGRAQMPAFREILSAEQIAAVLSYARNAWDNQATTVPVAQVLEGGGIPAAGTPLPAAALAAKGTVTVTPQP